MHNVPQPHQGMLSMEDIPAELIQEIVLCYKTVDFSQYGHRDENTCSRVPHYRRRHPLVEEYTGLDINSETFEVTQKTFSPESYEFVEKFLVRLNIEESSVSVRAVYLMGPVVAEKIL